MISFTLGPFYPRKNIAPYCLYETEWAHNQSWSVLLVPPVGNWITLVRASADHSADRQDIWAQGLERSALDFSPSSRDVPKYPYTPRYLGRLVIFSSNKASNNVACLPAWSCVWASGVQLIGSSSAYVSVCDSDGDLTDSWFEWRSSISYIQIWLYAESPLSSNLSVEQYISSSSVICQTTGPKPLPKRFLHIVRSRASSFNWQYPLLSLRSSSSFLRLLPRLLVTSICPSIFPSIACCRRQFLRKMWPIRLAFRFLISCRCVHTLRC